MAEPKQAPSYLIDFAKAILGEANNKATFLPPAIALNPPTDIDKFLFRLSCHQAFPEIKKPSKVKQPRSNGETEVLLKHAADLFGSWPKQFDRELIRRIKSGLPDSHGISSRLGKWYLSLSNFRTDNYYEIWQRLEEVAGREFDGSYLSSSSKTRVVVGNGQWMSIKVAARFIGVRYERLFDAVEVNEFEGKVRPASPFYRHGIIARHEVVKIKENRQERITKKEARILMGISGKLFDRLYALGVFALKPAKERHSLDRAGFEKADLVRLHAQLNKCSRGRYPCRPIALRDISGRLAHDQTAVDSILMDVFFGRIFPCINADVMGDIIFDRDEIDQLIANKRRFPNLSVIEVSKMTGWKVQVVASWCEQGFLVAERRHGGSRAAWSIKLEDLIQFQTKYSVVSNLADQLGSRSRSLIDMFDQNGIETVGVFKDGDAKRGYLIETSRIVKALGE